MQFLIDVGLSFLYLGAFFLLCAWTWNFWLLYVRQKYLNGLKWIMLEIKLPREIHKSPVAMETALVAFLQGGGVGNWRQKLFLGQLPATGSLEIASLEGVIHFYVRIEARFRPLVESSLYAQYPGIEIVEAEDYTSRLRYEHNGNKVSAWGSSYPLSSKWKPTNPETGEPYKDPDPKNKDGYGMKADFLPLKTYVDYGLDKDPKEEYKIDPLVQLLEFMGGLKKGEYFWYQILLQDESVYDDKKFPKLYINEASHKHLSISDMATEYKKQIRTSHYQVKGETSVNEFGEEKTISVGVDANGKPIQKTATYVETKAVGKKEMELTVEEKETIESINKKMSKPLAAGIIRLMYVTESASFNPAQIQNILSFPKPFNGSNKLGLSTTDPYDFPWQDVGKKRNKWRTEEKFEAYVEREGFFPHIPASNSKSTLDRMEDMLFWNSSLGTKKMFRMIYEVIFHPFKHPPASEVSTFNLEEIATLWHFPGAVADIPTLPRIDSAKGVPPVNLPQ